MISITTLAPQWLLNCTLILFTDLHCSVLYRSSTKHILHCIIRLARVQNGKRPLTWRLDRKATFRRVSFKRRRGEEIGRGEEKTYDLSRCPVLSVKSSQWRTYRELFAQCASMQVFNYASITMCYCTSVSVCQCASVPVYKCVGASVCQCAIVSVWHFASVPVFQYVIFVPECHCVSLPLCRHTSVPVCQCASVQTWILLFS